MNKNVWLSAGAGALLGAMVAFPLGLTAAGGADPERVVETKEVLPEACETLIIKSGEYIEVMSGALKAAAGYPLIVSEMAGMMQDGDYSGLEALADDMAEANAGVSEAAEKERGVDLSSAIDACAEYR